MVKLERSVMYYVIAAMLALLAIYGAASGYKVGKDIAIRELTRNNSK